MANRDERNAETSALQPHWPERKKSACLFKEVWDFEALGCLEIELFMVKGGHDWICWISGMLLMGRTMRLYIPCLFDLERGLGTAGLVLVEARVHFLMCNEIVGPGEWMRRNQWQVLRLTDVDFRLIFIIPSTKLVDILEGLVVVMMIQNNSFAFKVVGVRAHKHVQ